MKSFIESQFGYCSLIWMFHSRGLNNKRNCIYEKALINKHNGKSSLLGEMLNKNNFVTIHYRKLKALVIEIYKGIKGFYPSLLNEVFMPHSYLCSNNVRGKKN